MPSPRYWRELPNRFRLEAARCRGCGKVAFPARRVCPACRGEAWEPTALSWKGKVVTSTVVVVPPTEFHMEAPYAMAVVETPEGARLMTQVVDCDPATVLPGTEVTLVFRKIRREGHGGILCYGFKGVPAA
ncbi:MAG: OB-fold domain-containing protein [Acidobacteriia bacterium]|nr:OB-fold domain-containing protein [Terriglobia bacterium]